MNKEFDTWWEREGSSLKPAAGEDAEEHTKRVAAIAWSNGAYKSELTDALQAILNAVVFDDGKSEIRLNSNSPEIKAAHAAIAKATGVQP